MFVSGAVARHVDAVDEGRGAPADRVGISALGALAALIGDLAHCETAAAQRDWLGDYARRHGFRGGRYFHLGHFNPGWRSRPLRFLSTYDDRAELWIDDRVAVGNILLGFLPFAWSIGDGATQSAAQRDWYGAHGLRDLPAGVTVPVQDHASGPACLILFGSTEQDAVQFVDTQAPALTMTALAFHLLARATLGSLNTQAPLLTDREIACLRLAAMGETLADTAARLGVSVRTVELYVARANRKLNATNKIQAVAIAVAAGLIRI